jgi:uncharacterized protein DUF6653
MTVMERRMARAFGLGEPDAWQRHANPWSVYTRIPGPALLAAAVWSRARIGRWSLVPVGIVCLWLAVNPRVFPPPRSTDHWASRAVLGETFWVDREDTPVPPRHRVAPIVLTVLNGLGLPFVVRGLVVRDGWQVLFGLAVHMTGKNWFLDRMALLHDDMTAVPADQADPR